MNDRGLTIRSIDDVERLARIAVASGYTACRKPEEAAMLIITGQELGLSPMQSMRGIYVVSGKPVLSADLMVAVVRRSGLCESWRTVESTPDRCTITTRRKGESSDSSRTWTAADAKRAGLITGRGTWAAYPATMLRHRCAADLAREVYPDVLMGLYDPEELGGEPELLGETPAPVVQLADLGIETPRALPSALPAPADATDVLGDIEVQVCRCGTVGALADLWIAAREDVATLSSSAKARAWKLVGQRATAIGSSAALVRAEVERRDTPTPPTPTGSDPSPAQGTTDAGGESVAATSTTGTQASATAWRESREGITAHVATKGAMLALERSGRAHLRDVPEGLRLHALHAYAGRYQRLSHDGTSALAADECMARAERWMREGPVVATIPAKSLAAKRAAGGES